MARRRAIHLDWTLPAHRSEISPNHFAPAGRFAFRTSNAFCKKTPRAFTRGVCGSESYLGRLLALATPFPKPSGRQKSKTNETQ